MYICVCVQVHVSRPQSPKKGFRFIYHIGFTAPGYSAPTLRLMWSSKEPVSILGTQAWESMVVWETWKGLFLIYVDGPFSKPACPVSGHIGHGKV